MRNRDGHAGGLLRALAIVLCVAGSADAQQTGSMFQNGHMGGNCAQCHVTSSTRRYEFDPTHSTLVYTIDAYGFRAVGTFAGIGGGFVFDPADEESASVVASVDLRSLRVQNKALNSLILSDRFLDAEQYPLASFRSTGVAVTGENTMRVDGVLSIRGVEHPEQLEVEVTGTGRHPVTGRQIAGFVARGRFARSDFGLSLGLPAIADEITFTVYAEGNLLD
jgi:polyisoprenoid-binding protein YceI